MSLLDGKYEIIRQSAPNAGRTLFEATAPDGTLLRIDWFDLDAADEPAFERYRRVLKVLKREGKAAVYDVISRPGAHYVAWERVNGYPTADDDAIRATIRAHGFDAAEADLRRAGRDVRLYGLSWDGETPAPEPRAEEPTTEAATGAERATWLQDVPEWAWSGALALVMLALATLLVGGGFLRRANNRLAVVPDVIGQDVNAASEAIARLGLVPEPAPRGSSSEAGTVIALDPLPGTELRPGRDVRLTYALPPGELATTEAPQLVGLLYPAEALPRLRASGLTLGNVDTVNAATPANIVLAQDRAAGSAMGEGQPVNILISAGPAEAMTFLPDLIGLPLEEAKALAGLAGLAPDQVLEDPVSAASGAPDEVLGQSIAPYLAVPTRDATLRLIVQKGSGSAHAAGGVPNLTGLSESQVRALLPNADLRLQRVASTNLPEGVIEQDPPPGAEGDGTLTITLNQHPVALVQPDVRVIIERPGPRCVPYAWTIQPGIGNVVGEVYATPLGGRMQLARRTTVRGGQVLQGCWSTTVPGPVSFTLTLGGAPYGESLLVP